MFERHCMLPHGELFYAFVTFKLGLLNIIILFNEDHRRNEIEDLVSHGEIPHDEELEQHPEKSMEGCKCKYSLLSVMTVKTYGECRVDGKSGRVC